MHFDRNPFTLPCEGGKSLNQADDFKFGTFISRFPSVGVACMAVKGLI